MVTAPPATSFIEKTLTRVDGQPISNVTHMEFGPDGLLYASSLTGTDLCLWHSKNLGRRIRCHGGAYN